MHRNAEGNDEGHDDTDASEMDEQHYEDVDDEYAAGNRNAS